MKAPANSLILDIHQLAELTGKSEKALRCRLDEGLLPYRKWGKGKNGGLVFLRSEIEEFFRGLPGVSLEEAKENQLKRDGGQV